MSKRGLILLGFILILSFSTSVMAMEPDARSYSMGGAYTAVVNDASAVYWNPAMLSQLHWGSLFLSGGARSEDVDAITETLEKINNDESIDKIDVNGEGIFMGALATKWISLGVHANVTLDADGSVNEDAISASANGSANVRTDLFLSGHKQFKYFSLGVNMKPVLIGEYYGTADLANTDMHSRLGSGVSSDLAFATSFTDRLRFGLVFEDVLSSIKYTDYDGNNVAIGPEYSEPLDRGIRAGVAFQPGFGFTFAGDIDNTGAVKLGVEKNLFWNGLSVRGGVAKEDEGTEYRAGLGVNLAWLHLDLGVGFGGEENAPTGAMLNASLTF